MKHGRLVPPLLVAVVTLGVMSAGCDKEIDEIGVVVSFVDSARVQRRVVDLSGIQLTLTSSRGEVMPSAVSREFFPTRQVIVNPTDLETDVSLDGADIVYGAAWVGLFSSLEPTPSGDGYATRDLVDNGYNGIAPQAATVDEMVFRDGGSFVVQDASARVATATISGFSDSFARDGDTLIIERKIIHFVTVDVGAAAPL